MGVIYSNAMWQLVVCGGGIQEANDSDILMLMQYVFYYVTLKAVNTASASERDAFRQTPSSHASVLYSNIYNINSI